MRLMSFRIQRVKMVKNEVILFKSLLFHSLTKNITYSIYIYIYTSSLVYGCIFSAFPST